MKAYFSHDEGARNDPKLVQVMMDLGHEGKSVYWDLVEMLYEQGGYLMLGQCKGYAFALRTSCDLILKLVNDFGLFSSDGTKFWSETALRRLEQRNSKSTKAKESAAKRWANSERNANALPPQSEGNAIKEKETKVKPSDDGSAGERPVDLAAPLKTPPADQLVGGPARTMPADEAPVFTRVGFREYVKSIGFGHVDIGHYLVQIQVAAGHEKPRPNSGKGLTWEGFVKNYLNNDKLHGCLMLPDSGEGASPLPVDHSRPSTTARTSYDLKERAAAQAKPTY